MTLEHLKPLLRATPAMVAAAARTAAGTERYVCDTHPFGGENAVTLKAPLPLPKLNKRARRRARVRAVHVLLVERFPAVFAKPVPLAIGIYTELRAAMPIAELTTADLRAFLGCWTGRKAYQDALARGGRRIGLDGCDAGPAFGPRGMLLTNESPRGRGGRT
jgi:hypothetical protein